AEPLPLGEREARLAFLLIALAITLVTLVSFGVSPSLIRMLELSGASPMLALQLGSLRSVLGITARAVDLVLGRRRSPLATFLAGLGLIIVSTVVLLLFGGAGAAIVFVVLYGFGTGVVTVARALIPLVFFSPDRFARQSARLSLPQNLASAAAPVLMTAVLDRQGLTAVILLCLGLSLAALLALLLLARIAARARLHPISPLEGEMSRSDRGG
ncbi:MAG: MFS transporter, partial [Rhizobiaceae bacterium]|nr:MFS transporter [Rhizobiaceae bacterium]